MRYNVDRDAESVGGESFVAVGIAHRSHDCFRLDGLLLDDLVHAQPELVDDNDRGQWNFISHTDHDRAHEAVAVPQAPV